MLLSLLGSFFFLVSCASTNNEEAALEPMQKQLLEDSCEQYMDFLGTITEEGLQEMIGQAEHDKNAALYNGLTNYKNSLPRLGKYEGVESKEASKSEEGYSIEIYSRFEKRKMKLTLGLSEDMASFYEMTFEPEYSLGEELADAGGNLIIGMGTVFAVLLFIAWIISLFKYINIFEQKIKNRNKKEDLTVESSMQKTSSKAAAIVTAAYEKDDFNAQAQGDISGAELQAVIAAAIAAYNDDLEKEGSGDSGFHGGATLQNGLVVRSIRRR